MTRGGVLDGVGGQFAGEQDGVLGHTIGGQCPADETAGVRYLAGVARETRQRGWAPGSVVANSATLRSESLPGEPHER